MVVMSTTHKSFVKKLGDYTCIYFLPNKLCSVLHIKDTVARDFIAHFYFIPIRGPDFEIFEISNLVANARIYSKFSNFGFFTQGIFLQNEKFDCTTDVFIRIDIHTKPCNIFGNRWKKLNCSFESGPMQDGLDSLKKPQTPKSHATEPLKKGILYML